MLQLRHCAANIRLMSGKDSGDHLLGQGPLKGHRGKGDAGGRQQRRQDASRKYAGKTDMGRDELFKQRMGFVPKGKRLDMRSQPSTEQSPDEGVDQ